MASGQKVKIEDLITCAICYGFFDDPRLLRCSHTYCRKCIEQVASANRDQFECSLRDGCTISKTDIDSLPLNRAIRDLVELHGTMTKSKNCTICHVATAESVCDTCKNETFCSECYQKEHTSRLMQKHQQLPIDEKLPEAVPCETHPKKQLEYWCYTCISI